MFGTQITQTVRRYTGLSVNPHLFRHVGAKLYLDHNPGGYEVMRRVLGHTDMGTTTNFYAGLETRNAARHFDEQILKLRNI
jgi:integrase